MKLLIVFFCVISVTLATNYCDKELCKTYNGKSYDYPKHIACGGAPVNTCPTKPRIIKIGSDLQKMILEKHNNYRNTLAGGKLKEYNSAAAMTEMTWDNELAELAALNANTCNYGHDKCHNTDTHKKSGQNIGYKSISGGDIEDSKFIEGIIDKWWEEYKDCNQDVMDSYHSLGSNVKIGHFTAMANDRAYKIGCAATYYLDGRKNSRYLVCNYASTNMRNQPIYTSGKPRSACKKGKSKAYKNLCSSHI